MHSNLNAEREAAITTGERRLASASQALRHDFKKQPANARADYVRQQKRCASTGKSASAANPIPHPDNPRLR
ncbi:MAG: hypothetical protein H6844_19330 [Alphaproteobacteria bacterium]|nr:hypothetical protein [Alphaproteobacteria bacterium]